MNKALFNIIMGLVASALALGCGGSERESNTAKLLEGEDDNVDLYSHLTGIDDSTPVEVEEDEQPEQPTQAADTSASSEGESIGGGQGAFYGRLVIAGQEMKGSYTVKRATASGDIVKEDVPAGTEIKLDPGMYDFVFTTDEVVGNPELVLRDVEIPAGRRIKRDVKMPVGKITLVTGARCAKKAIRLRPKGATEWYEGKFYTCVEMTLRAGEYEAEMGGKKRGTPISGIQVYDGGIRDILIRPQ